MLEVVVAVAIAAILAALTVVAQAQARGLREKMQCLNSLRQWSIALSLYAHEHDNAYPPSQNLYSRSPEVGQFMAQYLHIEDSGAYQKATLPLAMCKSGAATDGNDTALIGWTLLAGYQNVSNYQYNYTGLDFTTEDLAQRSAMPIIACMTSTDGSRWIGHDVNLAQNPKDRPQGQTAAWPDGHARWVQMRNLEPAVQEFGSTYFMPGKNLN